MINLLPPEDKRQIAASRTNTLLLRYSILLGIIVGFLLLELVGMNFVVDTGTAGNEAVIKDNETKTAKFDDTKKEAATFKSNLATAKYILGKQIPYNTLIFTLAKGLPSGAVIDTVALDPTTFGTPTSLTVKTISYAKAVTVKKALQDIQIKDGVPLFDSVSFQAVDYNENDTTGHHYTASFNVTYSKAALTQ